jgi:hypothetical protein
MTRIPIHDDGVPIACTASSDELPVRIETIERLRSLVRSIERTDSGLRLTFPADAAVVAEIRQFTVDEKQCCQFWGFAVERAADELILRWEGPPAVDALFDELLAFFEGDEPLTALAGLL